jgi:hypothetical protein
VAGAASSARVQAARDKARREAVASRRMEVSAGEGRRSLRGKSVPNQ